MGQTPNIGEDQRQTSLRLPTFTIVTDFVQSSISWKMLTLGLGKFGDILGRRMLDFEPIAFHLA